MLDKLVPIAVFSNGTDCNELHPLNMLEKFVPAAVFSSGIVVSDEHP